MKILQVNTNDVDGGAARSAYRLHQGMLETEIKSLFFVQRKHLTDTSVFSVTGKTGEIYSMLNIFFDIILRSIIHVKLNTPWSINLGSYKYLQNIICRSNYDILHLHWINNGFFPLTLLKHVPKPIVWTLHDSWAFTGGCHIPYECKKYWNECNQCEQLSPLNYLDISQKAFHRKKKIFKNINMHIVTPSKWLYECAKRSQLLKDKEIHFIPNGIDVTKYRPLQKSLSRNLLGISLEKKIILFGAMSATSDPNKGFEYLIEALNLLNLNIDEENTEIIVFGSQEPAIKTNFVYKSTYMGRLQDDISLTLLYSAADVMIVPSKSENLPNTIMESLACGTPCVAFNIGGIPDLIDHKENGYLAKPYEPLDLAHGIEYVLDNEENWQRLSQNARSKIVNYFELSEISQRYSDLYEEIIRETN